MVSSDRDDCCGLFTLLTIRNCSLYLFYAAFAVTYICPLGEQLGKEPLLICQSTHDVYHKVNPYYATYVSAPVAPYAAKLSPIAGQVKQKFDDSVVAPVSGLYEKHLAKHTSKAGGVYTAHLKPTVTKVQSLYSSKLHPHVLSYGSKGLKWIDQQVLLGSAKTRTAAIHGWAFTRAKSAEIYEVTKAKSIEGYHAGVAYTKSTVWPKTVRFSQLAWLHGTIFGTKAWGVTSSAYVSHVHPSLIKAYYLLKLDVVYGKYQEWLTSPFGQYLTSTASSITSFVYTKVYEGWVVLSGAEVRNKIGEQYAEIEHQIEEKKEFLKGEFNRIFSAGFNTDIDRYSQKVETPKAESTLKKEVKKVPESSKSASPSSKSSTSTTSSSSSPAPVDSETPDQYQKYQDYLLGTSKSALENFTRDVERLEIEISDELTSSMKPKLQALSKTVNSGYEEVHSLLHEIDRVCEADEQDCPPVEYVSRQDFRDALAKLADNVNDRGAAARKELDIYSEKLSQDILSTRSQILEILQDFADASLQEYSHAIMDASGKERPTDNAEDTWDEWKRFHNVKNQIFATRDEILTTEPKLEKFKKLLSDLNTTLYVLVNESGQYLAILRAQANLKFQAREAREAKEKASKAEVESEGTAGNEEYDEEYEDVETETVVKYITMTIDDDGHTLSSSETVETPVIIDDGSVSHQKHFAIEDEIADETVDGAVDEAVNVESPVTEDTPIVKEEAEDENLNEKLRDFESIYSAESGESSEV
ncbi:unnamed protein product [Kuraishia capsulata CBS 1993]|uniref:Uncharacterized protein n=1 Tax=Kuraishia capsulata CBS 1993 TaxID=1382522 RepID=W6MUI6_9ASCO|nr:uncharacterized protein KUCA_T00005300001 [Kuraishia capsulata CBS 1993]CDK29312.1 unnamed protein product [Kuraishia capsulata CBS 1993]